MESKDLALRIAGFIFSLVAILHFLRIVSGVPVLIAGRLLPVWINWLGLLATGFLSIWLWRLSFHKSDS